jgi:pyruvate/2-oxoglutarate dehydrogenase complex dihydrolipoamide acyltransferase (E2) component
MSNKINSYQVIDLPPARQDTPNFLDMFWWRHLMFGLLEVDVTLVRQVIAEHKARTGEKLSFTGYLAFCLAYAVDEDKSVQGYLKGRKQVVIFDDVDVGVTVEREMGGKRTPVGHIIRGANHKTYLEIHQEIRAVQTQSAPRSKGLPPWFRFFLMLPWPIPRLFIALMKAARRRDPDRFMVAIGGTVGVTSVGMFGKKSGWGLTSMVHSLGLVVGGIAWKPAVVEGRIEPREMLNLTVTFDHDVVDGAPAARFVQRLMELIESGYGLDKIDQAYVYPLGYSASIKAGQVSRLEEK